MFAKSFQKKILNVCHELMINTAAAKGLSVAITDLTNGIILSIEFLMFTKGIIGMTSHV